MKLGPPITFTCRICGKERTGVRRRCYECTTFRQTPESREKLRQANLGKRASAASRQKNAEWHKAHTDHYFDLGATTRGKPPHNVLSVGTERRSNGHIKVKCDDGKWRYRARLIWEREHGPITKTMLVHHINEDPYDDALENLQLVTRAEHARIHSTPETMRWRGALAKRKTH